MDVNYRSTRRYSTPYGQPSERAVRYARRMIRLRSAFVPHMQHVARVLASPLKGVYSTHIERHGSGSKASASTLGGLQWP